MTCSERPRGRPPKNDTETLAQVADLMIRDPALKHPTTAMNRVIYARTDRPETDATLRRRLQDKWKRHGATMLAAARERARPKPPTAPEVMALIGTARLSTHQALRSLEVLRALEAVSLWDRRFKQVIASPELSRWLNQMASISTVLKASPFLCGVDKIARSRALQNYLRLTNNLGTSRRL